MEQKAILLIDDDPVIRETIRDALDGHYAILEASCSSEAVKFSKHDIDLVLVNYVLPDSDGFEVLKALRNGNPTLPAIIMTANGSEGVVIEAIRAGATGYISKPLRLSSLKQHVSEIFNKETTTRQHEHGGKVKQREASLLDSIVPYIEEHYAEHLTLDLLAHKVNMNKFRFCKIFKEQMGQTFTSYLNNVRIRNAAGLLEKGDLNITEVAYVVGYSGIVHFARVFKEMHGVSPREYRKKFRDTRGRASYRTAKKVSIL